MNLVFNELSINSVAESRETATTAMRALSEKIQQIKKIQKDLYFRTTQSLMSVALAENYYLKEWMKDRRNEDVRNNLNFMLTTVPIDREYPPYYQYESQESKGLGIAHEDDEFAISLNLSKTWDEDQYGLTQIMEENLDIREQIVYAKHFGAVNEDRITQHLIVKGQRLNYDCDSKISPRDNQTILFDSKAFLFTGKYFDFGGDKKVKRKIYRRSKDNTLWYVDNLHYGCAMTDGKGAHLEVFDKNKNHIGIADIITGAIKEGTQEKGRSIKFLF